jgi:DNA-binding transcriptional regulator YiaG
MKRDNVEVIDWRPEWKGKQKEYYNKLAADNLEPISSFREFRERLGLSQKEVAELLETTQSNVSKIEARSNPTISVLEKIVSKRGGKFRIIAEFDDKVIEMHS